MPNYSRVCAWRMLVLHWAGELDTVG